MGNSMREGKAVTDMRLAFVLAKSEKLTLRTTYDKTFKALLSFRLVTLLVTFQDQF